MTPKPRLTGEPILRILCKKTDALVGYLYRWNNGDLQSAWFDDAMADVRYVLIEQDRMHSPVYLQDTRRCAYGA